MERLGMSDIGRFAINDIRRRLDHELEMAVSRLRPLGGAVSVMELPTAIGDHGAFANEVDGIQVSESREIGFATRELLVERVKGLVAAVDRLNEGEYGTCVECAEAISTARLRAVPEVQTCVRCQAWLERQGQARARWTHATAVRPGVPIPVARGRNFRRRQPSLSTLTNGMPSS
jgi:RNA polymerase-binding transcription factor DksA